MLWAYVQYPRVLLHFVAFSALGTIVVVVVVIMVVSFNDAHRVGKKTKQGSIDVIPPRKLLGNMHSRYGHTRRDRCQRAKPASTVGTAASQTARTLGACGIERPQTPRVRIMLLTPAHHIDIVTIVVVVYLAANTTGSLWVDGSKETFPAPARVLDAASNAM